MFWCNAFTSFCSLIFFFHFLSPFSVYFEVIEGVLLVTTEFGFSLDSKFSHLFCLRKRKNLFKNLRSHHQKFSPFRVNLPSISFAWLMTLMLTVLLDQRTQHSGQRSSRQIVSIYLFNVRKKFKHVSPSIYWFVRSLWFPRVTP